MTHDTSGPVQPPQPPEPPAYGDPSTPPAYAHPPVPPTPPGYQPPAYPAPAPYQAPPAYQAPAYQPPSYQVAPAPQQPAVRPPYAGYGQPAGYTAQGYPIASYPGYGSAPGQFPAPSPVSGLAIGAIIVSAVAFLIGWLPFIGPVVALTGLTLSIVSLRRPRGRVLGIIGIVLSSLALLTGLVMTLGFLVSVFGG
ncbi:hypothetical protein ACU045_00340 [Microbacterium sp. MAHUQ-60]|uniref:hypothetical protein n=1 Tax=unclassified Microbacterium TaxID=2609290 RepID=UPI0036107C05